MFGARRQPRPRRLRPDHPRRPRPGHQLRRHRRHVLGRASPRRSSARRCRAAATTSCSPPRCTSRWARAATAAATRGAGSSHAVEDSLRRLHTDWIDLYQIHRPDPATDIEETLSRAHRPRPPGQDPRLRLLDVPGRGDRRGPPRRRAPRAAALPHRAAAVLDARPRDRDLGPAGLPALRDGRAGLEPARLRVPDRPHRKGRPVDLTDGRAALTPDRFDPSLPGERRQARRGRAPGRARRRARLLAAGAGVAFTVAHPRGDVRDHRPRAPWTSSRACSTAPRSRSTTRRSTASTRSSRPARTSTADGAWRPPALTDPALRRRAVADRAAA